MRNVILIGFCVIGSFSYGQSLDRLKINGHYTYEDSIVVVKAYQTAQEAVELMYEAMENIWYVPPEDIAHKEAIREKNWEEEPHFVTWLGSPEKMKLARKRIHRIRKRLSKKVTLHITKQNRGRCRGWISAWTIPYGRVRITLCEDFFIYRTRLQDKVLIHEIGHEAGMPFHHRIHGCRSARRAAISNAHNITKKSPENYAWLAMSFLGLNCRD